MPATIPIPSYMFEWTRTLNGHTRPVVSVSQLKDERLVSCSADHTIKIWDQDTGDCSLTLNGHTKRVCSVNQLKDGRIVSCSLDNTIKIWGCSFESYLNTRLPESIISTHIGSYLSKKDACRLGQTNRKFRDLKDL